MNNPQLQPKTKSTNKSEQISLNIYWYLQQDMRQIPESNTPHHL
jgi:hypothetical protein